LQLLHLVGGEVVELGEAFADHEFAEAVGVVTDHEEQLQAALGGFADAGAGEVLQLGGNPEYHKTTLKLNSRATIQARAAELFFAD